MTITVTYTISDDTIEDEVRFQRHAHSDALYSIVWRMINGTDKERLCEEDIEKVIYMLNDEGIILDDLWR
jgi:uncharacterized protein YktB (UPF0637 family)